MGCGECVARVVRRWRSWVRLLLIAGYVLMLLIVLPLVIVGMQLKGAKAYFQGWTIAGMFVLLAVPISFWGILQHIIHYTQPYMQRHIIRILWMVPIYAINAWLALRLPVTALYLDTMRECYEAYVIYNFMRYILNYLQHEYPDLAEHLETKDQVKHLVPFCCFPAWPMGRKMVMNCKHGVLQYTVVRPVTTIIALICQLAGVYKEGDFNSQSAWLYLTLINNISQIWAMYCLILFYKATKEELKPIRPIPKFLCVKFVVFFSFWQSVLIAALVQLGVIKETLEWSVNDVATGLQDFLICIEMFLAAIAHYYSFSHKPFVDRAAGHSDLCESFANMWDVSDVRDDVMDHVRHVGHSVTRPLRSRPRGTESERSPLLNGETGVAVSPTPRPLLDFTEITQDELDAEEEIDQSQGSFAPINQSGATNTYLLPPGQANASKSEDLTSIDTLDSSMDASDTYQQRSFTASMTNYAHFSESEEVTSIGSAATFCSRLDAHSEDLLVHIDSDNKSSSKSVTDDLKSIDCAIGLSPGGTTAQQIEPGDENVSRTDSTDNNIPQVEVSDTTAESNSVQ